MQKTRKRERKGQLIILDRNHCRPVRSADGTVIGYVTCLRTGREGGKVQMLFQEVRK